MSAPCGTCRFWKSHKDGYGDCRRHPPQLVMIFRYNGDSGQREPEPEERWPMTRDQEWCGEYEALPVPFLESLKAMEREP